MAKSNLNIDNDIALRKGLSAVYKVESNRKLVQDQLKDDSVKQATMNFIFGLSDVNPIVRNKN
jgi:hypothetical protein